VALRNMGDIVRMTLDLRDEIFPLCSQFIDFVVDGLQSTNRLYGNKKKGESKGHGFPRLV
jgi:hypothetical protein